MQDVIDVLQGMFSSNRFDEAWTALNSEPSEIVRKEIINRLVQTGVLHACSFCGAADIAPFDCNCIYLEFFGTAPEPDAGSGCVKCGRGTCCGDCCDQCGNHHATSSCSDHQLVVL